MEEDSRSCNRLDRRPDRLQRIRQKRSRRERLPQHQQVPLRTGSGLAPTQRVSWAITTVNGTSQIQSRIDTLEAQLEREQKKNSGTAQIDDADFVKQSLSTDHRTLTEILKELVESGTPDDLVRKQVEDQLYFLAS